VVAVSGSSTAFTEDQCGEPHVNRTGLGRLPAKAVHGRGKIE
jgi:hypothetical protein